jgi:hypothetical protein
MMTDLVFPWMPLMTNQLRSRLLTRIGHKLMRLRFPAGWLLRIIRWTLGRVRFTGGDQGDV